MNANMSYHGDNHDLKTSEEWHQLADYKITEPYGWNDGLPWEKPISKAEFQVRAMKSVIEWRMSL